MDNRFSLITSLFFLSAFSIYMSFNVWVISIKSSFIEGAFLTMFVLGIEFLKLAFISNSINFSYSNDSRKIPVSIFSSILVLYSMLTMMAFFDNKIMFQAAVAEMNNKQNITNEKLLDIAIDRERVNIARDTEIIDAGKRYKDYGRVTDGKDTLLNVDTDNRNIANIANIATSVTMRPADNLHIFVTIANNETLRYFVTFSLSALIDICIVISLLVLYKSSNENETLGNVKDTLINDSEILETKHYIAPKKKRKVITNVIEEEPVTLQSNNSLFKEIISFNPNQPIQVVKMSNKHGMRNTEFQEIMISMINDGHVYKKVNRYYRSNKVDLTSVK